MFTDKQIKALSYEVDKSRVKSRQKGNITLSYLEGFDIIDTANRIFGFGNWSYSISSLEKVSEELNQNQNHIICYKAVVKILVYDLTHSKHISREDVGFGTGIAKTLADANEGGAKEAVTDALKRAMRSFGNQFGNSLYDRSKNHASTSAPHQQQYQRQTAPQPPSQDQFNYQSLYNLGLRVVEQGNYLIVTGDDIFSKRDSIKACGFKWDGKSKVWYKPIQRVA